LNIIHLDCIKKLKNKIRHREIQKSIDIGKVQHICASRGHQNGMKISEGQIRQPFVLLEPNYSYFLIWMCDVRIQNLDASKALKRQYFLTYDNLR
jgi:hypothetical protein